MAATTRCSPSAKVVRTWTNSPAALISGMELTLSQAGSALAERLTPMVRSRAKYRLSLEVLRRFKEMAPEIVTKSGIMLGLGETEPEIFQTMDDLREAGVQVLTMGQYLRPTPQHLPVVEYVHPDTFRFYKEIAEKKGFEHVASGPLVRSSYHAADFNPVPVAAGKGSGE